MFQLGGMFVRAANPTLVVVRRVLVVTTIFVLSGCASFSAGRFVSALSAGTSPEQAQRLQVVASDEALARATNIIDAFYQLPYDLPLSPGRMASYEHADGLPVMFIDGHRTYVKGLQVTGPNEINSVVIKSHLWKANGGGWRQTQPGSVVFPSVLFLSDQFQPLADIKRPDFNYVPGSLLRDGRGALTQGMSVSINVPEPAQRATYIVLYVSPENRQGVFSYCEKGVGMVRFNSTALPAYGGLPCHAIPFGMAGKLDITIH